MKIEDFDYDLPPDRIAQVPAERRDGARLMLLDRAAPAHVDAAAPSAPAETTFDHLADHLREGDLVVLNDTRVLPARLRGRKPTGGRIEILLLPDAAPVAPAAELAAAPPGERAAMLATSKGIHPGARLDVGGGVEVVVLDEPAAGRTRLRFTAAGGDDPIADLLERRGVMPLPPYIHREPDDPRTALDRERYQTVYAASAGAIAAPTAGLHFTPALLDLLPRRGIAVTCVTLHVGPGTFQPVRAAAIEDHVVEPEWCRLPAAAAAAIAACRERRGRVVAVGTTVVRVLESRASGDGGQGGDGGRGGRDAVVPGDRWCDLYIRPGHRFRVVDVLLTNLHLPRSSLLILVAAFAGRERILAAYREAVRRGFRFYSYGDAMLIT
jgi:S-adenosylmethionine:tRNA ribosyltransferase-isomerase